MEYLIFISFVLQFLCFVESSKNFRLGRRRGGNLGAPFHEVSDGLPPAQWFEQKLDHFSPTDLRTWSQRYFVNESFYDFQNPGPVFFMISGEGAANASWMVKGSWIEYAKTFKAFCINIEHRYYGESHPTKDFSVKNLQYLSSLQALADLANFISKMNVQYKFNKEVKWVTFGGSYPGSLAAWMRLKYPHLVYAAVSSSGPLLAKSDFDEYFAVVFNALTEKTGNENCANEIRMAFGQIAEYIKSDPKVIEKEFRVCHPFSNATEIDIKNFFNGLANDIADVVQYNEDNRLDMAGKYKNMTINNVCNMLTSSEDKPAYKKFAAFVSIMLEKYQEKCLDYSYTNMINEMKNISLASEGGRQWMYQTCTEFGFYATSSKEANIFGDYFNIDYFTQMCQDVFGRKYNKDFLESAVDWTNNVYGALNIPVSRVVFVHGSIDPWHALGITHSTEYAPAIYIHGTAHCANVYPSSDNDSSELVEARNKIEWYLKKWLGQTQAN